jgi:hypothetical protein
MAIVEEYMINQRFTKTFKADSSIFGGKNEETA